MSKRAKYLDVNWVELGCRGWDIDGSGAELTDGEWNYCHLDRTSLDIIAAGPGAWWARVLRDLADAWVPGLEAYRTWQTTSTVTAGPIPINPTWSTTKGMAP